MANRRLLDPNLHVGTNVGSSKVKAAFLTLALVSFLLPISCANFNRVSTSENQQRQPSEYQVYSDSWLTSEPALDREKSLSQRLQAINGGSRLSLAPNYYYDSSASLDSNLISPETNNFYPHLSFGRQVFDDQAAISSPIKLNYDYLNLNSDSSLDEPNSRLDAQLYELIGDGKFRSEQASSNEIGSLIGDPIKFMYADPKVSTFFEPVQSQTSKDDDKVLFEEKHQEPLGEGAKDESQWNGQSIDGGQSLTLPTERKNFTTLLEDEESQKTEKTIDSDADSTTIRAAASKSSASISNSPIAGPVETGGDRIESRASWSSTLRKIYDNVISYLPSFRSETAIPRANITETPKLVEQTISGLSDKFKVEVNEKSHVKDGAGSNDEGSVKEVDQKTTKHSVRVTSEAPIRAEDGLDKSGRSVGGEGRNSVVENNDKHSSGNRQQKESGIDRVGGKDDLDSQPSSPVGAFMDSDLDSAKIGATTVDDEPTIKHLELVDKKNNLPRVGLMRTSNLMMPFESTDEPMGEKQHPDGLMRKYIYAPEHHYYLNSGDVSKTKNLDLNGEQLYEQMSHRSHPRHLQTGDTVYGSYSGFTPLYAAQASNDNLALVSKTNDVYFLVMVAAFCVMAMTVVLSAGLFAYRVQQSRKSTSDSDYPTYGVVGPSNPGGKCNAAAFVGGYFTGVGGAGSMSSVSKVGSTKGSPDILNDSGIMPSVQSGGGKTICKKTSTDPNGPAGNNRPSMILNQNAARMYHYQHQKQQMIISDRASSGRHTSASDLDSEDENDDESYTVYECPGLASAHEMEIKNPLFNDDQSP